MSCGTCNACGDAKPSEDEEKDKEKEEKTDEKEEEQA